MLPVAVWQVRLRTAISVFSTLLSFISYVLNADSGRLADTPTRQLLFARPFSNPVTAFLGPRKRSALLLIIERYTNTLTYLLTLTTLQVTKINKTWLRY